MPWVSDTAMAPTDQPARPTVLVVDDSATARSLLRTVLEAEQLNVVTAGSVHEALAEIQRRLPDVVITDTLMPGADGFSFIETLKEHPATLAIPVVMLTSTSPDDWKNRAKGPQPDVFVEKTSHLEPLLAYIRTVLKPRRPEP
jgi:CheY-like chemotaxis protein